MDHDDVKPPSDDDSSTSDLIPEDSEGFDIKLPSTSAKQTTSSAKSTAQQLRGSNAAASAAPAHRPRGGSVWTLQGQNMPNNPAPTATGKTATTTATAVERRHRDLYEFEQALQYRAVMNASSMKQSMSSSSMDDRSISHMERLHLGALVESYLLTNGLARTMQELHHHYPALKDSARSSITGKDSVQSQLDVILLVCEEVRRVNMLFDDETAWKVDRLLMTSIPLVNLDLNSQAFGGTVEVLFEKLVLEEKDLPYQCSRMSDATKPDFHFTNVFLVMAPLFVCPQVVISLSMKMLKTLAGFVGRNRPSQMTEARITELLHRVVVLLEAYVFLNAADLTRTALERLASFCVGVTHTFPKRSVELSVAISALQSTVEQAAKGGAGSWRRVGSLKPRAQNLTAMASSNYNPNLLIRSILDIDDSEVSRQICLLSFSLFERIHLREFFHNAWTETSSFLKPLTSNLSALVDFSSKIQLWVSSLVVSPPDLETRRTTFRKFVRIGRALYNAQNFEMVNAILEGLHHPAVQRMKRTTGGLDSKEREELEGLLKIMDPFDNTLQDISYHITSPSIPTIGPILGALYRAEDGAKTNVFHEASQTHVINWSKLVQLAKPAFRWISFQSVPYEFYVLPNVQRFLWQMPGRLSSPDLLTDISVDREP